MLSSSVRLDKNVLFYGPDPIKNVFRAIYVANQIILNDIKY